MKKNMIEKNKAHEYYETNHLDSKNTIKVLLHSLKFKRLLKATNIR